MSKIRLLGPCASMMRLRTFVLSVLAGRNG